MSALQKLQEKIEQWRQDHEALKEQNKELKNKLSGTDEAQKTNESLVMQVETKTAQCTELETAIATLKRELEEKDVEIEKIISQVESLLS